MPDSTLPAIVVVNCLQESIVVGEQSYFIYAGFITPRNLDRVACAPAFTKQERHESIAMDIMKPSTKNWQRPLIEAHRDAITATFNSTTDFMPNPVLLSKNDTYSGGIGIAPHSVGGTSTGLSIITLDPSGGYPLWIIDGQHRIKGLAASKLADQKIPVVLLLDDPYITVYKGPTLAKIFAQVTTQATALQDLHSDWLKYAFRLDKYASSHQLYKAMTVVAELASIPQFQSSRHDIKNQFFDSIQFNDYLPVANFREHPSNVRSLKILYTSSTTASR